MKIQTKKSNKKTILLTIAALVLLISAGVTYAYTQNIGPFEKSYSTKPATDDETSTGSKIKKNSLDSANNTKDGKDKVTTGSDPLPEPTPGSNGEKSTVGMEITAANQNGPTVSIRTLIQTVASTGSCALTMQGPNGNTYTATAEVQPMPTSTTCKGFDIPTAELMTGQWSASVSFENDELKGSDTKEVTIK